ncbi:NAD(P)H-hydrate epimerase [Cnuella takakiae]|uniref:ADP-dependent (S)-NAD(P)H-hydrate dehydratase n=2 Tax=Cnuella takakiae TaxID=1302690 RepID=A0A1M4V3G6_9BACT|nr:NAD(P)H-hydrate epimerase [Cnuella takakiae]
MERAAAQCVQWLLQHKGGFNRYTIICGKGNNGGDGLAIGRLLQERGIEVVIYILEFGHLGSTDFQVNLQRLHDRHIQPHFIQTESGFPQLAPTDLVIDALFGSGLNRPLDGLAAALVNHLNAQGVPIISIDVPSGMLLEESSAQGPVIRAGHTLSFQNTKMAFLLPENGAFTGQVHVLDIGLHKGFSENAPYTLIDQKLVGTIYKSRSPFGHKGNFGHVLMVGGATGKMGAMVLSAKAALRAGAGLVSVLVPRIGYFVVQTAVPEAMCMTEAGEEKLTEFNIESFRYEAIGIGPGMGTAAETQKGFSTLLSNLEYPVVLDADALNCLAQQPTLLSTLPKGSILTPHQKEFERLFGICENDFARIQLAQEMARQYGLYIILKGHHSLVAAPDGQAFFNSTGNAGMATGGSGDVLTGILTSLLGQGYTSLHACILGVYLHGLAGDIGVQQLSEEALVAGDIVAHLGAAFRQIRSQA